MEIWKANIKEMTQRVTCALDPIKRYFVKSTIARTIMLTVC